MGRPQQVSDQEIYQATVAVVNEMERNFSTREVALQLGVSPQAILKRMDTKAALLSKAFGYFFEDSFSCHELTLDSHKPVTEQVLQHACWLHEQLQIMDRFRTIFFANDVSLTSVFTQFDTPPPVVVTQMLTQFFERALKLNLIEKSDAYHLASIFFSAIGYHAHLTTVLPDFNISSPLDKYLEMVCELVIRPADRVDLSHDGLPIEIERKYLLTSMPDLSSLRVETVWDIEQGYIPGQTITERIRRATCGDAVKCTRTVKLGEGVTRIEFEDEIDPALFSQLWAATKGYRVTKKRHVVSHGRATWELDQFTDRGLVLLEIELASEHSEIEMPQPMLEVLVGEVTHDKSFTNWALSRKNEP
jgi:CYTH domain-containing protein